MSRRWPIHSAHDLYISLHSLKRRQVVYCTVNRQLPDVFFLLMPVNPIAPANRHTRQSPPTAMTAWKTLRQFIPALLLLGSSFTATVFSIHLLLRAQTTHIHNYMAQANKIIILNRELNHLFPIPFIRGFTTSTVPLPSNISHKVTRVPLENEVFKPQRGSAAEVVPAPLHEISTLAWHAFYPKGSINPSGEIKGGFSFYLGKLESITFSWEDAKEILVSYAVFFPPGFQFQ